MLRSHFRSKTHPLPRGGTDLIPIGTRDVSASLQSGGHTLVGEPYQLKVAQPIDAGVLSWRP
jgi:hypothetical protein